MIMICKSNGCYKDKFVQLDLFNQGGVKLCPEEEEEG